MISYWDILVYTQKHAQEHAYEDFSQKIAPIFYVP